MHGNPVPRWLQRAIEHEVEKYPKGQFGSIVAASGTSFGPALAIKYMHPKWAEKCMSAKRLGISINSAFTWGAGTYVAPLAYPLSSAIYGRCGIVSSFDPTDWQVFDATDRANQELYLRWARYQRFSRLAQLTMHSAHYHHLLRNSFRTNFEIDCVLFRPDQYGRAYTDPGMDVWMAVADWDSRMSIVKYGSSKRFTSPKLSVLIEEEFEDDKHGIARNPLLKFTPAHLISPPSADDIAKAYNTDDLIRVPA